MAAEAVVAGVVRLPDLKAWVGSATYKTLRARQRADLALKAGVLRGWAAFSHVFTVPRGMTGPAVTLFLSAVQARYGVRVQRRKFQVWRRALRLGGPAALVDRRGRPCGARAVSAVFLRRFLNLIRGGSTMRAAQRELIRCSVASGHWWPRRPGTVRRWFRGQRVPTAIRNKTVNYWCERICTS